MLPKHFASDVLTVNNLADLHLFFSLVWAVTESCASYHPKCHHKFTQDIIVCS